MKRRQDFGCRIEIADPEFNLEAQRPRMSNAGVRGNGTTSACLLLEPARHFDWPVKEYCECRHGLALAQFGLKDQKRAFVLATTAFRF
jgi:hypothetical protein